MKDFEWETALIHVDLRRQYGETRFVATGLVGNRVLFVVFSLRDTDVRLISVRRANSRKVRRYADQD